MAGKYERTSEIRAKISQGVLKHFLSVGCSGRGEHIFAKKLGRKLWVRSTWEARVVQVLDRHPCVLDYIFEPYSIPYEFEGRTHFYIPDFKVSLEGFSELWEIKPQELRRLPKNVAKEDALNRFCLGNNLNSRIVTHRQLEGMERQVGLSPWVGAGGPWVDLEDPDYRPRSPAEQQGLKE